MKNLRVAAVQYEHSAADKSANLGKIRHFVNLAAGRDVEMIVFPECCLTGYWFLRHLSRSELVSLAGGANLFGALGEHSPWLDWEDLRASDPDVIVILPCGFDLVRTRAELGPLLSQPGFGALRAVGTGRVFLTDGHQYFNRPGPRLVESLEILCELLHPEVFPPTHRGERWDVLG